MFRFLMLLAFSVQAAAFSSQFTVRLDAPYDLIQNYSAAISLGIRYWDDSISSAVVFELKDLKAGVRQVPFEVRDGIQVKSCEYQWAIMNNPPLLPGETPASHPELLVPERLSSTALKKNCTLDLTKKEIVLDTAPYELVPIILQVSQEALSARGASAVFVGFSPVAQTDTYATRSFDVSAGGVALTQYAVNALLPSDGQTNVSLLWILKGGSPTKEEFTTPDRTIVIR